MRHCSNSPEKDKKCSRIDVLHTGATRFMEESSTFIDKVVLIK